LHSRSTIKPQSNYYTRQLFYNMLMRLAPRQKLTSERVKVALRPSNVNTKRWFGETGDHVLLNIDLAAD